MLSQSRVLAHECLNISGFTLRDPKFFGIHGYAGMIGFLRCRFVKTAESGVPPDYDSGMLQYPAQSAAARRFRR
jgi:hypothetical protein